MSMFDSGYTVATLCALALLCLNIESWAEDGKQYPELGRTAETEEIRTWDTDVRFDGDGLPQGEGSYAAGKVLYQEQCAACHGEDLKGVAELGRGPLIGPGLTVEQHWPFAPTLFDYVRRAMPFPAPNSLGDEEVYALCAYILGEAGIHPRDRPMNAAVLADIQMPNKDNFVPDPRPDVP